MYFSRFSHRRYFLSLALMGIGLVSYGYLLSVTAEESHMTDTLYIIDNSLSMAVEDIGSSSSNIFSSRLEVAKKITTEMIGKTTGKQGVIIYAKNAGVVTPMTDDTDLLIDSLSQISPVIDNGGSDVSSVFSLVNTLYARHDGPIHIVLLSDGGDTSSIALPDMIPETSLTIIGIGTDAGGPIPLGYDALGNRRYKIYQGKEVRATFDKKNIEKIRDTYDAVFHRINTHADIPESTAMSHLPIVSGERSPPLSIASLALLSILISIFLHPYARTTPHA